MASKDLQEYLHEQIPLSKAMGVEVLSVEEGGVVLRAPLAPNINHRETVFGGSASAVAILAAWSLLHTRMLAAGLESRIVIQRNSMEYLLPIDGTFTARSAIDQEEWGKFLRMLTRRKIGRIVISAVLEYEGRIAGSLQGEFVAFGADAVP